MLVVFDTNIWKSDLYLRSPTASAVRTYLRLHQASVGLPEVVELEVKKHLRADISTYRDRLAGDHKRLLALFGKLPEVVLPTDEEIQETVDQSIESVGLPLVRIPFSLDAAKGSFLRVIEERPPSAPKDQQFKDGIIWEDCMQLSREQKVILVTKDQAFYEGRRVENGLAHELAREIEAEKRNLLVVSSLSDLLTEIRRPIDVPAKQISEELEAQLGKELDHLPRTNGFHRCKDGALDVRYFATEEPKKVFVHIAGRFPCEELGDLGRTDAMLHVACDGAYDIDEMHFSGLSPTELELNYAEQNGEAATRKHHFIRAGTAVFGHRKIEHRIRYPLE